jgi:UDP-N-acetylmuramoyl-tripeptide--D-alanyl-D-alanine ligase
VLDLPRQNTFSVCSFAKASNMNLAIDRAVSWAGGTLHGGADTRIQSVSSDTRTLRPGALFAALPGARFDGHDLLAQAHAAGAAAALVVRVNAQVPLAQIVVADVPHALGQLAHGWIDTLAVKRIALTGSNGKTTVKNLTASILQNAGETLATQGNLNNELGLPLTVLSLRPAHRFAVLEMGAGQPCDIAYLAKIANPDVALVNNAMAAHLERLGSVHGVAVEKSSIYRALRPNGVAVINLDDSERATFNAAAERADVTRLRFSTQDASADVYACDIVLGATSRFTLCCASGTAAIHLPLLGLHNVRNALAATALSLAAGASFAQVCAGLQTALPAAGRLRLLPQQGGWRVLDDSYNANPGSLAAGMDALVTLAGEPWVVLGNMAELGQDAQALHADVGAHAQRIGIRRLYCLGDNAAFGGVVAGATMRGFPPAPLPTSAIHLRILTA